MTDFLMGGDVARALGALLKDSPKTDNCLVLAYGYLSDSASLQAQVWDWLNVDKQRHLLLVMGIHGKPEYNLYLAASTGSGFVPLTATPKDIAKVAQEATALFKPCVLGVEALGIPVWSMLAGKNYNPRLHVVIAEHFHAKLAMTVRTDSHLDFHRGMPANWQPTAAVMGSSNVTYAAAQYNIEFDVMLERGDHAALAKLGPKSVLLLNAAIAAAAVDDSASAQATEKAYDLLSDYLANAEYEHKQKLSRNDDAKYREGRLQADADMQRRGSS